MLLEVLFCSAFSVILANYTSMEPKLRPNCNILAPNSFWVTIFQFFFECLLVFHYILDQLFQLRKVAVSDRGALWQRHLVKKSPLDAPVDERWPITQHHATVFYPFNILVMQVLTLGFFVLLVLFLQTADIDSSHFSGISAGMRASTSFRLADISSSTSPPCRASASARSRAASIIATFASP